MADVISREVQEKYWFLFYQKISNQFQSRDKMHWKNEACIAQERFGGAGSDLTQQFKIAVVRAEQEKTVLWKEGH